jgi:hypothetical protein
MLQAILSFSAWLLHFSQIYATSLQAYQHSRASILSCPIFLPLDNSSGGSDQLCRLRSAVFSSYDLYVSDAQGIYFG